MSRDPLGLWGDPNQRGNGQSYCGNDPINLTDAMGLGWTWSPFDPATGDFEWNPFKWTIWERDPDPPSRPVRAHGAPQPTSPIFGPGGMSPPGAGLFGGFEVGIEDANLVRQ